MSDEHKLCPNCGRCPTCGHVPVNTLPWLNYPYIQPLPIPPYYPDITGPYPYAATWTITCGARTGDVK